MTDMIVLIGTADTDPFHPLDMSDRFTSSLLMMLYESESPDEVTRYFSQQRDMRSITALDMTHDHIASIASPQLKSCSDCRG